MTASLNERYNALLLERAAGPAAALDLDALTERVHASPMLENSYFGHFLPQPIFVEAGEGAAMERDLVGMVRLLRSLPARLFGNDLGRMCDAAGMTPLQRRAVLETMPDEVFLSRADLYQGESGFKLLEVNIGAALGGFENAELNKALLAAPFLRRFVEEEELAFPDTIDMIAAEIHRAARRRGLPPRPRLVVVEWPSHFKENDILRMRGWADQLSARGFDGAICHAGQLQSGADGALLFEGKPVDVLYRYFLIEDLLDLENAPTLIEPILAAQRRGRLLLAMGFGGELLGNKRNLAFLSDEANRPHFSRAELDLIDRMVPWTRTVRPGLVRWRGEERDLLDLARERQRDFVLKPSLLHGALGFVAGWVLTPEQWRGELERACAQPYVIQERVVSCRLPLAGMGPDGVSLQPTILNWGIFVIDDRIAGAIIRGVLEEPAQGIAMSTGARATGAFWRR